MKKDRPRRLAAVMAIAILGAIASPDIGAQQNPPAPQSTPKKVRPGSTRRALALLATGAGLFFGGAALLNSADRYEKGPPVCIYFLGCYAPTNRITSRGRQVGGAVMMGSGAVVALLGYVELSRKPFVKPFDTRSPSSALQAGGLPGTNRYLTLPSRDIRAYEPAARTPASRSETVPTCPTPCGMQQDNGRAPFPPAGLALSL
jgi:hypothetical protein